MLGAAVRPSQNSATGENLNKIPWPEHIRRAVYEMKGFARERSVAAELYLHRKNDVLYRCEPDQFACHISSQFGNEY